MGIIVFELFTNSCFQNNGAGDPKSTLGPIVGFSKLIFQEGIHGTLHGVVEVAGPKICYQ